MTEVPVYLPRRYSTGLGRVVVPKSAIVGYTTPREPDLVIVYYEGNRYGAQNMVTFADRAMIAYWRMRDHYPTVAMMAVPAGEVVRVGTLYPEFGKVEVEDVRQLLRLSRWLEIDLRTDRDKLQSELLATGVRV